ncbi:TIGR01457 family HAD-type hydrolase [Paenibacillus alvei]|uniref:Acid sugar phosphatase n=1 Tax=Paenibacillus alvei TaxID=44250 RepID=A0AAP7DJW5_PAEAL|nr:TIGR01457 family HAD-type hydrolase [Paenibacillus alvei]MBG9736230.1 HAD family hydrolase [Paenibacillus alvei]MBG9745929.1 HAD family hydrolase [Paenibacillus alvei]MCY9582668.1 TIGR01457 family HAD-type hydrolase [Paenibacillus alvei]MCY9587986.1 TIGR01457 family HAD-type hydrolase [Paenibacillus alvei]NOJ72340.1 TIGR01457 family HAD-type hydrolase [Paenibacillus alvei]
MENGIRRRNRYALIDLDGTMYHGTSPIEGADKLIETLRSMGIPYLFVTNNSTRTPEEVAVHLQQFGISAVAEDVLTSAQAAASYIKKRHSDRLVFMIGEYGLQRALEDVGISWTERAEEVWGSDVGVVVQGLDRNVTYAKLEAAACAVREGAVSILTNPDVMLPSDRGFSPGAGTIGAAIQSASGVEPVVIGKPSAIIMDEAMKRLGCTAQNAIVIGDNMMTDILAGANAGCRTALTYTGVTTPDNYESFCARAGVKPDMVFHNMEQVRKWFMKEML